MRVLAVDYGDRRIGLAVSDPTQTVATGLPNLEWDGRDAETVFARLRDMVADYADGGTPIGRIVVGLPLAADGSEGPSARKVRRFMAALTAAVGLPVEGFDERHTTEEARKALRDTGWSGKKKKRKLDVMAALLILRGYLDSQRPPPEPESRQRAPSPD